MRVNSGIFGLDRLLGGGFLKNTLNAILGTTGSGKTIFSIQFLLEGLENGEKCIYISFDLEREDLERVTSSLGWNIGKYIEEGRLKVGRFYVENIAYLNDNVLSFIIKEAEENSRVVIDSFTPLVSSFDYNSRAEIGWFFKNLKNVSTALITLEEPLDGNLSDATVTIPLFLSDSVIHLKNLGYGELFNRTIRIVKHRFSWHEEGVFPYSIVEGAGIVIENKISEGFKAETEKLNISDVAKRKIAKFAENGIITKEDLEKILRRLA
jgi:KaiC/GvpD/RAD55 family RecA-like ATPase